LAFTNEQHRRRYAEDPEHRARKLAAGRAYRAERREQLNALWREKWKSNPGFRERWRARRRRAYGLVAQDYERMLREQNGVCAICGRKSRRELCVDHCHATQRVRGLLCDKCNTALGLLGDDADRMRAAGAYVDRARGGAGARGGRGGDIFKSRVGFGERAVRRIHVSLRLRAEAGRFRVG
jgi:hypothetical protein